MTTKMEELYRNIITCMEELSEAKGITRCSLIYALAQLIDTYKNEVNKEIGSLKACIADLEKNKEEQADDEEKSL